MSIITLTSDYGLVDHRVGAIKGSILSLNPEAKIVDISHNIEPYDIQQAAYILKNVYPFFPKNSIHLVAVDSFYHKERKSLVYKVDGHYFVTVDNGIISLIFSTIKPDEIYEITLNNRFDDVVNFTATDVLAPAAVHLFNGGLPEVIGRKFDQPKEVIAPKAVYSDKIMVGQIIYIDNFGNAVSNISKKFFMEKAAVYPKFSIKFRNFKTSIIYNQYTDIVTDWSIEQKFHGKAAAIFNDAGFIEITIYKGTKYNGANSLLGISVGEKIYIEFD